MGRQQISVVDDETLTNAQADGLACIYCGRSARRDGSLGPLRPPVRPPSRSHCGPGQAPIGRSVPGVHVSRCEPPCPSALNAYRMGFGR